MLVRKNLGATVSVVRNQLTAVRSGCFFLRGLKCLEAMNTLHFPCGSVVKNPLAMQWVLSMGPEDPLKKEMATHSTILAWKSPMDGGAWQATILGITKESEAELCNQMTKQQWMHCFQNREILSYPRERGNPVGFRSKLKVEWGDTYMDHRCWVTYTLVQYLPERFSCPTCRWIR